MYPRLKQLLLSIRERLWVKPLVVSLLSIGAALLSSALDATVMGWHVPEVSRESIEDLLKILAASMMGVATFAVASMVAAYSATGNTATPRAFPLVVADDVSQNALSTFVGAFIFSVVALIALMNGYYGQAGRFSLFALTLAVLAFVVFTFTRWVDSIARLGRLGSVVAKVEQATAAALERYRRDPARGGVPPNPGWTEGEPVFGDMVGYVQDIDTEALQQHAEHKRLRIAVWAIPGTMVLPGRAVAMVSSDDGGAIDTAPVAAAFTMGPVRKYDHDPRFGLVALGEIAGRALSPAVNDPGTAIGIITTLTRLLSSRPVDAEEREHKTPHDRVSVVPVSARDMFDDAFTAIARDGAGLVEIGVLLQQALAALGSDSDPAIRAAARAHADLALARAELALTLPQDLAAVRQAATAGAPSK
ncbi:DUF2254 domain-containing protein [Massilia soli]|uniref:DUF2254 domain-containing protein n=1 Tax=Massilia soli TaxID=2792854 RepID=A0ABS7SQM3_9BURK|nr:DUF2254 domain-containing protein [Massilia soli]MBZ2208241.1 DUF2254 domain-containing protein [Massilia soli]